MILTKEMAPALDQVLDHAVEQGAAELLVSHLAAAEHQHELHLVALLEEALGAFELDVVVVIVGVRAQPHLLQPALVRVGLLLLLLVLVLAEVHDLADRRVRLVGDFDEVESGPLGTGERLGQRDDADLFAVGADEPYLAGTNLFVDPGTRVTWRCYCGSLT